MKINRRKAIKIAAAAGVAASFGRVNEAGTATNPYWITPFSPPKDYVRDLTPGPTPVRLCSVNSGLHYPARDGQSLTEQVRAIREKGYTACESGVSRGTRMSLRCSLRCTSAARCSKLPLPPCTIALSAPPEHGQTTMPAVRNVPLAIGAM